jgi:hypothetical protein
MDAVQRDAELIDLRPHPFYTRRFVVDVQRAPRRGRFAKQGGHARFDLLQDFEHVHRASSK